jgi:predicted nucleic acid-binding protein
MSDRFFVDTSILMYAHDSATGEKHERAKALVEELWETRSGVISTRVLQELAVNLRRRTKKPLDARATREVVSDYLAWQGVVNGGDSILEAMDIEGAVWGVVLGRLGDPGCAGLRGRDSLL